MCFGCIILDITIPCFDLWVPYFFFMQSSSIHMSPHPQSCAQFLFVCTQFMEGCSQHNSSLPSTPLMPAPILTPTDVCQWRKKTICFSQKQNLSWFQNVWGPHEQIWECSFAKNSLVKYCCCEPKVTNTQAREQPTSGKKGVCPSDFSAPTKELWLEMRGLSSHLSLFFSEMSWLM